MQEARREVEYQLGQLTAAVEGLGQRVNTLDRKLFGNGQPGVIQVHRLEIDLLKQELVERRSRQKVLAAIAHAIGGLLAWSWMQMVWPALRRLLGW